MCEFVLTAHPDSTNVDVGRKLYEKLLRRASDAFPCEQKELVRVFRKGDQVFQVNTQTSDSRVFEIIPKSATRPAPNVPLFQLQYTKRRQPYHMFPCTDKLNDVYDTAITVCRCCQSKRVTIQFQEQEYDAGVVVYRVCIVVMAAALTQSEQHALSKAFAVLLVPATFNLAQF